MFIGLETNSDNQLAVMIFGGLLGGVLGGGLFGYRRRKYQRYAALAYILLTLLAGLGLALVALGAYTSGGTSFTCQRSEPTRVDCHLAERRWFGLLTQRDEPFQGVQSVRLDERPTDQSYWVTIVTITGDKYLYNFGRNIVGPLKRFLDSTRPTLVVELNEWPILLIVLTVGSCLFLTGCAGSWGIWDIKPAPVKLPAQKLKNLAPAKPFEIVEHTPTKLVLRVNPEKPAVWLGIILMLPSLWVVNLICREVDSSRVSNWLVLGSILLLVGCFFLLGLGIVISNSQAETITLDKVQTQTTITRPGWLGRQVIELPFSEIAEIREVGDQVLLTLTSGRIIGLRSGGSAPKMAKLLHDFVKTESDE